MQLLYYMTRCTALRKAKYENILFKFPLTYHPARLANYFPQHVEKTAIGYLII